MVTSLLITFACSCDTIKLNKTHTQHNAHTTQHTHNPLPSSSPPDGVFLTEDEVVWGVDVGAGTLVLNGQRLVAGDAYYSGHSLGLQ